MKDTLKNHLIRRDTELSLIEQTKHWDTKVYNEAIDAWIELTVRVNRTKNEEIRKEYLDKLNIIHTLFDRFGKLLFDKERLESEYKNLYDRYDEQVEINRNLEKDFDRNEMTT